MRSSHLLVPVAAAVLLAAEAMAAAYIGCGLVPPPTVPSLSTSSATSCINSCQSIGWNYAFYKPSGGLFNPAQCWCGDIGHANFALVDGGVGTCDSANFIGYSLGIPNTFSTCASSVTPDPRDGNPASSSQINVRNCETECNSQNKRYAVAWPRNGDGLLEGYDCKCYRYPLQSAPSAGKCSTSTYYVYQNPAIQLPSDAAQRRRQLEAEANRQYMLKYNPYCPQGLTPCRVAKDPKLGYECLRIDSELESCGGCRYGEFDRVYGPGENATFGVDCTSLPGVNQRATRCIDGQCQISRCRQGFRLRNGACVSRP